jgi:protein gp37
MADGTKIEWTDATWNVINGCRLVSEGCRHCYAAHLAATRLRDHPSRKGLARMNADGEAKFTGEVRFIDRVLDQPLRWKKPRMVFVCAHGDLFYEKVPDAWIDRVFAVMALSPQHTFQVLTKRPERMRNYLRAGGGMAIPVGIRHEIEGMGYPDIGAVPKALPNVLLGVSVEDQATADERVPILLDTPAAIRWVSYEPALGPVDFKQYLHPGGGSFLDDPLAGALMREAVEDGSGWVLPRLDWIVAGGESGPHARPAHPDWFRKTRDDCAAAGVPFFMKQLSGPKGRAIKDIADFPADLQIREYPNAA